MDQKDTVVLTLNAIEHRLPAILSALANAPTIYLDLKDLNSENDPENGDKVKVSLSTQADLTKYGVVVTKQFGRFTVLLGQSKIDRAIAEEKDLKAITAKLVSPHAMKLARVANYVEGAISSIQQFERPVFETKPPFRKSYPKRF